MLFLHPTPLLWGWEGRFPTLCDYGYRLYMFFFCFFLSMRETPGHLMSAGCIPVFMSRYFMSFIGVILFCLCLYLPVLYLGVFFADVTFIILPIIVIEKLTHFFLLLLCCSLSWCKCFDGFQIVHVCSYFTIIGLIFPHLLSSVLWLLVVSLLYYSMWEINIIIFLFISFSLILINNYHIIE